MQHPPELQQLFCCVLSHTFCHVQVKLNKFFTMQNTTCPNILWCLYLFCALFVLYLEQLYTKQDIYILTMTPLEDVSESTDTGAWSTMKTFVKTKNNTVGLNTCKSIPLIRYSIHWHLEHQWLRNLKLIQLSSFYLIWVL